MHAFHVSTWLLGERAARVCVEHTAVTSAIPASSMTSALAQSFSSLQIDVQVKWRAKGPPPRDADQDYYDFVHSIPLNKEDIFAYNNVTEEVTKEVIRLPGAGFLSGILSGEIKLQVTLDITRSSMTRDFVWNFPEPLP